MLKYNEKYTYGFPYIPNKKYKIISFIYTHKIIKQNHNNKKPYQKKMKSNIKLDKNHKNA